MSSRSRTPRSLLFRAGAGALPVLLVLALGLLAVRRERELAFLDARQEAVDLAARQAEGLRSRLLELALPSAADVLAFRSDPTLPGAEPCERIDQGHPGALAWFVPDDGGPTYPGSASGVGTGSARALLDPAEVPLPARETSERAYQARSQAGTTLEQRLGLWRAALEAGQGTPAEGILRLHTATAALEAGHAHEAIDLFESVALARPPWPSETGLSTRALALRGRVQAGEIEASSEWGGKEAAWVHRLLHALCVENLLPESCLTELSPAHRAMAAGWREVAARHGRIRAVLPLLPSGGSPPGIPSPTVGSWEWIGTASGNSGFLRSSHAVEGGTWWLLRPSTTLREGVVRGLAAAGVPEHLAATVTLEGREILGGPGAAQGTGPTRTTGILQAAASAGPVGLRLDLARPESLEQRIRQRTRRMTAWVGIAALGALAASLAVLRMLARQERLTELQTDFVASVSHELRAPLAAVRLMAEELCDVPGPGSSRRADYHRLILRESRRLSFLIENVLRHARLERGSRVLERRDGDLREVLLATRDCLRPSAEERGIGIRLRLPDEPVAACIDAGALQQVFVNLVDNALKHSTGGAEVEVVLEPRSESRPAHVVSVIDHGPGIPAEEQERIFEPFYRRGSEIRRETAGVGLGLSLARRLVVAHGGTLRVRSEPGRGATFLVTLPVA